MIALKDLFVERSEDLPNKDVSQHVRDIRLLWGEGVGGRYHVHFLLTF